MKGIDDSRHPLSDCYRRLAWADADAEAIDTAFRSFVETNPYRMRTQIQGREGASTFDRVVDPATEAEVFDRVARLFGSHLDNVRAALNYVAYQLALLDAPSCPKLRPDTVEFPIFRFPSDFRKKYWIKQLPDEHRELLESVQPYDGQRQGLWVLHELARFHRHRLIHPARMALFSTGVSLSTDADTVLLDIEVSDGPMEDGQILVRFTAISDKGNPQVHPNLPISIGIDHVLCQGQTVTGVLNAIRFDVANAMTTLTDSIWPDVAGGFV